MTPSPDIRPFETQFFECECHSSEHVLHFCWDDEDKYIYTTVYLHQYRNIFKRLWVAIKYVFGYRCRYGHWDCTILKKEDAPRLRAMLDKLEAK